MNKERIEQIANEICFEDEIALRMVTQAVNEALEDAARECETLEGVKWNMALSGKPTTLRCSEAIRRMKV